MSIKFTIKFNKVNGKECYYLEREIEYSFLFWKKKVWRKVGKNSVYMNSALETYYDIAPYTFKTKKAAKEFARKYAQSEQFEVY